MTRNPFDDLSSDFPLKRVHTRIDIDYKNGEKAVIDSHGPVIVYLKNQFIDEKFEDVSLIRVYGDE